MSSVAEHASPVSAPSPYKRGIGFLGLALASFLGCIDLTIVTTALPSITDAFGTELAVSQLVLTAFLTALAMLMVTAGRLGDHLGRKPTLLVGIAVFVVASVGAALAPTIGWLIAARFLQGAGCAILYTGTSTLVGTLFDENSRGRAVGWLYAVNGIGLALGPVLGGVLVPALGWAAIFWINVPFGLGALLAIAVAVGAPAPGRGVGLDLPGQALLAVAVGGLVVAVSLPETAGWFGLPVAVAAIVSVVGVVGTVVVERRTTAPLLRLELLRNRSFRAALASDFLLAVFYAAALLVLPLYLADRHGLDVRTIGFALLLVSATMAATSPLVGRWTDRAGTARPLLWGFSAFVLAGLALLAGSHPANDTAALVLLLVGFVFFGVGWALILAPATLAALSAVSADEAGFAVGASWTFHNLGGALGAAIAAGLFTSAGGAATGLTRVAVLLVVAAAAGVAANLLISRNTEAVQ